MDGQLGEGVAQLTTNPSTRKETRALVHKHRLGSFMYFT